MDIMNLPSITDGTDKQKMYADSIRLQFIAVAETDLPELLPDLDDLMKIHTDARWWIDRRDKIGIKGLTGLVTAGRRLIKKNGSVEGAHRAARATLEKALQREFDRLPLGGIYDPRYKKKS